MGAKLCLLASLPLCLCLYLSACLSACLSAAVSASAAVHATNQNTGCCTQDALVLLY